MQAINLLLIWFIVVYVIDLSGIVDSIKVLISKYLTKSKISTTSFSLAPFDCSLCMTHHMGLIYLICTDFSFTYYALTCLLSFLSLPLSKLLFNIRDSINKTIDKYV